MDDFLLLLWVFTFGHNLLNNLFSSILRFSGCFANNSFKQLNRFKFKKEKTIKSVKQNQHKTYNFEYFMKVNSPLYFVYV